MGRLVLEVEDTAYEDVRHAEIKRLKNPSSCGRFRSGGSRMEQFDQLLTCCVCLDRYRTPKLLPCMHSYCMEPCMEGLVDYVKRQVKCPECRAEHRVPYNGIQGFPTNITLQKFLELHTEITGELPDPNADAIMSRCAVCSEKAYVSLCAHCDKKVCDTCKDAHCDILKREISRINNQIKRGMHRIEDTLGQVERNQVQLKTNADTVVTEIDEIHRRLTMALKERTDYLKSRSLLHQRGSTLSGSEDPSLLPSPPSS